MNSEARHFTVGLFVLVQIRRSSVEKNGMQQLQSSLIGTARMGGSSAFIGKCKSAHIAAAKTAKDAGAILSYDPPNLRIPLWPCADNTRDEIFRIWDTADIIKICEEEIEFLTKGEDYVNLGLFASEKYDAYVQERLSLVEPSNGEVLTEPLTVEERNEIYVKDLNVVYVLQSGDECSLIYHNRYGPEFDIPCGHGILYAHPKFKVNAALVLDPWVMGISPGWFRARGIRWLTIGNHVRITGLWANGNHVRITDRL
uniref:Uncharacterized protein n=1 Tax=Brassica oleracea var. oleracea TaxID=109376 RepID=A0A0D3CEQ3_BRAOL